MLVGLLHPPLCPLQLQKTALPLSAHHPVARLELRSLNAKAAATGLDLRKKISKAEEEIQKLKDQTEHLSEKTLPCALGQITIS